MGDEKLIQVATNFILNSPPGEFVEVVADVRGLVPDEQLLNRAAPETFRRYNTEQMLQVESPNNKHQVLITQHGEVGPSAYLDPRGKQVVLFDHLRQQVSGVRPINKGELDADVEPYRAAFDREALKYVGEYYIGGATTVYGKKRDGEYQITIAIATSKYSPNNFWNGRWRSTWQVTFAPSAKLATINGMVQVNVHYYEEGNVQLNNTFEKQLQSQVSKDPQATAAQAMKTIIKAEHAFHSSLDTSYATMGSTTFKALRRMLPITVQKIDWNKIRALRLGAELKRG